MKLSSYFILPCLVAPTASAFVFSSEPSSHVHRPWTTKPTSTTILHLQKSVQDAIQEAQRVCEIDSTSNECKVAWDIVEELEAAESHRGATATTTDSAVPDIGIGIFLDSMDILIKKIDGKMDQLKGTSYKLQELGANDPAIVELAYQADTMKQALANARDALSRY